MLFICLLWSYSYSQNPQDPFGDSDESNLTPKKSAYLIDDKKGDALLCIPEDVKLGKFVLLNDKNSINIFRLIIAGYAMNVNLVIDLKYDRRKDVYTVYYIAYNYNIKDEIHVETYIELQGKRELSINEASSVVKFLKSKEFLNLSAMTIDDRSMQSNILGRTQCYSLEYYLNNKYEKIDLAVFVDDTEFNISDKYKQDVKKFEQFQALLFRRLLLKNPTVKYFR